MMNFWVLIKKGKNYYLVQMILLLVIFPLIVFGGHFGNVEWYEEELIFMYLYQYIAALFSGIGLILFLQELVDEEGRELLYIRKKLYLKETFLFFMLNLFLFGMSLFICSFASYYYQLGMMWLVVELFLLYGLLYFILFIGSSVTVAVGVLVVVFIVSFSGLSFYASVVVWESDNLKEMLYQAEYMTGLGIVLWSLGTLANYRYRKYE